MMANTVPMTKEGHNKLKAQVQELEKRRPQIKEAIENARAKGDLRENADYHAAREELGMLNAKLGDINSKLARAYIIDPSKAPKGKIVLGSTVKIKRLASGSVMERTLVGAGEADVASGKILTTSPVGEALIGHKSGDVVTVSLPRGDEDFEVMGIS